jgi:hypothetical protein
VHEVVDAGRVRLRQGGEQPAEHLRRHVAPAVLPDELGRELQRLGVAAGELVHPVYDGALRLAAELC